MTFVPTISAESALGPQYEGANKVETWDATAAASDSGPQTIQSRHLTKVTDYAVQFFNGTGPSSVLMTGASLLLYLPGTTSATRYHVKLMGRFA